MSEDKVRLNFTTSSELAEDYEKWSKALGITKSQFISMSCALGAKSLARQMFPEDFMTADLFKELEKAGMMIDQEAKKIVKS